jgi:Uncharacterised nucleotidyltransferase
MRSSRHFSDNMTPPPIHPKMPRNIFPDLGPVIRYLLFADFNLDEAPPSKEDWRREWALVASSSLAGVAQRLVGERSLDAPTQVVDQLKRIHFDEMASTANVVRRSHSGLGSLRSANIPFVVIKGPGIAVQEKSLADRPYMDLDVLVAPKEFRAARTVLASQGYEELSRSMAVRESFNRYCREAVNLRSDDGGSIDLHHRVSPWYWSSELSSDLLARDTHSTRVFGIDLQLPSPEHNLLVAALHIVSDKSQPGRTYRAWRDLLLLVHRCPVDDVVEMASEAGLAAWLAWILTCLPRDVRPDALLDALASGDLTWKGEWRLNRLIAPQMDPSNPLTHVFRLPFPNAGLYLAGMVVPSPKYLRYRYPPLRHRYIAWWRDSMRELSHTSGWHAQV